MNIDPKIFKSYDIRGTVPEQINEENIYQITQSVLHFIQTKLGKKNISIAVGRDMRLSAPTLYPIFKKALVEGGARIIDNGLVATPTFYFSVLHLKTDAGIQLTASHNPPQYNGMKMVIRDGDTLSKIGGGAGMEEIKQFALDGVVVKEDGGGETAHEGIGEEEVQHAFKLISPDGIKPLKIVADPANAMASTYIETLFKHIPGELIKMNFELDGSFPAHQPDPLVFANLKDLQKKVIEEKADLGLAPDGDGDRMFFVDEKGQIIPASFITALVAKHLLQKNPGETILYDIRYIITAKKIITEYGGKSDITRVGHAFITRMMGETGAIFGGESSGHYFFRHTGNTESQVPIILIVLQAISESGKPLSEVIEKLRRSFESGEFNFKTENALPILDKMKKMFSDAQISTLDGVSIEYPTWRCNVWTSSLPLYPLQY
jgi:phosphomannomutase